MSIYAPNEAEKEILKDSLASQAIILGLFSNLVVPDGSLTMAGLTELPTGGGRGYAPIEINNDKVVEGSAAADQWSISVDSNGKALATYSNVNQQWVFNATDVADGNTAYGVFGYSWQLPFKTGLAAGANLKAGDTVTGGTSGATGVVTAIRITSGAWSGGDAAGYLCIKTKTGTFQNGEVINISGPTQIATTDTGTTNAGDALKKLRFVDVFATSQPITPTGFTIAYPLALTMASG